MFCYTLSSASTFLTQMILIFLQLLLQIIITFNEKNSFLVKKKKKFYAINLFQWKIKIKMDSVQSHITASVCSQNFCSWFYDLSLCKINCQTFIVLKNQATTYWFKTYRVNSCLAEIIIAIYTEMYIAIYSFSKQVSIKNVFLPYWLHRLNDVH